MLRVFPKKSLGQNFLSNPKILDKIVDAAEITKEDTVLEIGPGTGNLTKKLAEKSGQVVAIEKDHRLIESLRAEMPSNVKVIEGDILKFSPAMVPIVLQWAPLQSGRYKIIGNIPYYLTSHLIRTIFEEWPRPKLIVLTIQKEVAQRIVAQPPDMSILAISVQYYSDPKIIDYISKGNFKPTPKIDSAIIRLRPKNIQGIEDEKHFFEVVRLGFSSKRKKLIKNLGIKYAPLKLERAFAKLGLTPNARAQELSVENWIELSSRIL